MLNLLLGWNFLALLFLVGLFEVEFPRWKSSGMVFPYGPSLLSFFGRILNRWNFLGGLRQDGFRGWKFFALPFLVGIF